MGFDLEPQNADCKWYHNNIMGWQNNYHRLEAAGADLTLWSWHNDGNLVPKETAESWGALLMVWLAKADGKSDADMLHGMEFADFLLKSGGFKIY